MSNQLWGFQKLTICHFYHQETLNLITNFFSLSLFADEVRTLIAKYNNTDQLDQSGITVAKTKYMSLSFTDRDTGATCLVIGGFGRVELVQISGDTKNRSFALKQMKKSQVC